VNITRNYASNMMSLGMNSGQHIRRIAVNYSYINWRFDNIGAEQFGAERLVIMRCCAANIDAFDLTNSGYVDIIIGWAASISWFVNNGDKTFG